MNPSNRRKAENFYKAVQGENITKTCKVQDCNDHRAKGTYSSYCQKHKARVSHWFHTKPFRFPTRPMLAYAQSMGSFLLYNEQQLPIKKAKELIGELLRCDFHSYELHAFDKHLKIELIKRKHSLGSSTDVLSRLLGVYMLTVEHPHGFPDTSEGIKPYLVAAFYGAVKGFPGRRSRQALMCKLDLFIDFLHLSAQQIFKFRNKNPKYLTNKVKLKKWS